MEGSIKFNINLKYLRFFKIELSFFFFFNGIRFSIYIFMCEIERLK